MESFKEKTSFIKSLFMAVKKQHQQGDISTSDYLEVIENLLEKLNEQELNLNQITYMTSYLSKKGNEINIKDMLSYVLAMN